jgi:hypothetical protein
MLKPLPSQLVELSNDDLAYEFVGSLLKNFCVALTMANHRGIKL